MIRAFSLEIAHAQALNMPDFFWYQMRSDRIEQNFSYFRTSRKAESNLDAVMIEELVSESLFLDQIYGSHPEMRRPSRCLSRPSFNHLNPPSILGNPPNLILIALENVSLSNCWVEDRRCTTLSLKIVFSRDKNDFVSLASEELEGVKVNMFRPRGSSIDLSFGSFQ